MAQGKKTDNETILKVMLSYTCTGNFNETARVLNLPESTVRKIYYDNKDNEDYKKLCEQKKLNFVEKANRIIDKTLNRIEQELDSDTKIPLNQLATTLGITLDKKTLVETGATSNETPVVQVNIVDNSNLESTLYEEED